MRTTFALVLVFSLLVAAGCSDDRNPMEPVEAMTGPPAESGIVVRDGFGWGTTLVDASTGYRSIIGISGFDFCSGSSDFSVLDLMWASTPVGNSVIHIRGEAYAEVWPIGPFDCETYLNSEPIATGMVHVVRTDNDWFLDGNRMNAYGWRAQGTLYGSDGTAYRFSEVISLQWPDGSETNVLRHIQVKLTPTGRR